MQTKIGGGLLSLKRNFASQHKTIVRETVLVSPGIREDITSIEIAPPKDKTMRDGDQRTIETPRQRLYIKE